MTLKSLLEQVAGLVEQRDTIDHGRIRCLHSQEAIDSIMSVDDCDEVDTGSVGDDDLASALRDLGESPEKLMGADAKALADTMDNLVQCHHGADISDYLERDLEDELGLLDKLISAAEQLIATL